MLRDWASEKTRGDFVATLDALDAAARSATGKGLAALLPDRRAPVVAAFDADRIAALDSAYIRLRELTLIAYYLSEPGATQELRRSEEHTSELQSLMRNSYAVFCLKKKRHYP